MEKACSRNGSRAVPRRSAEPFIVAFMGFFRVRTTYAGEDETIPFLTRGSVKIIRQARYAGTTVLSQTGPRIRPPSRTQPAHRPARKAFTSLFDQQYVPKQAADIRQIRLNGSLKPDAKSRLLVRKGPEFCRP